MWSHGLTIFFYADTGWFLTFAWVFKKQTSLRYPVQTDVVLWLFLLGIDVVVPMILCRASPLIWISCGCFGGDRVSQNSKVDDLCLHHSLTYGRGADYAGIGRSFISV